MSDRQRLHPMGLVVLALAAMATGAALHPNVGTHRVTGLISGLRVGPNTLTAAATGASGRAELKGWDPSCVVSVSRLPCRWIRS